MKQRYVLRVNGAAREAEAEPHESLLDVLRENLRLTGSKKGCNEAECGSCTVLLNGRPVVSCLVLVPDAVGRDIVTIEALAEDGTPHPVQRQMVEQGGVQCGYCTPGMIMSAYALLQEKPHPTDEEIRFAISGNICRCTGYGKIVKAVRAAAEELGGGGVMSEDTSRDTAGAYQWIGTNVAKPDALEKALGATEYVGDMVMPGMLHAKILWAGMPHGVIRNIDTGEAARVPGVAAVVTASDVPGTNRYGLAVPDQRALADDKVRSAGDALALVAAEDEEAAEEAVARIKVDIEPLRPILTYEDALDPDAPAIHEGGNVFQHTTVRKGDLEQGIRESDVIVENAYHTHRMDHVPMEPEAGLAYVDPSGVLNILVGTQYPYRDRRQIAPALGLAMNKVRVIQAPIGGGFGRKDDITAEIHAGLLALKTRRPVRLVYTREESLIANTKRHPMAMSFRTGARSDGRLTFLDGDIYGDTGAGVSLGAYVVKKAGIHATGPYDVPNIRVDTYTLYTNNLVSGAMRGFGVMQAAVAHESQMDQLAHRLGMSPLEFRIKNCLKPGLASSTGQLMNEGCGIEATLQRIKDYMSAHDLRFKRPQA